MSATQISRRVTPISAVSKDGTSTIGPTISRPLGRRFGSQIHSAFDSDIREVFVEEQPGRALAAGVQHFEEIVVGRQFAERVEVRAKAIEHDTVDVDAAIFAGPGTAWQRALIDQARNEIDSAVFPDQ